MKKAILLSAAVLAMTACSETEVIENGSIQQTNAIGFQSLVNKASRAIDNDNFKKFFVFGSYHTETAPTSLINIFNEVPVTKSGDKWEYTDARYWIEKCTYTFAAYAVDDDALTSGSLANFADNTNLTITNFLVDNDNQKDLIYADIPSYGPAAATGNPVQSLTFKHILSRVSLKFTNNFPAGYNIKVKDIKIINIRNKGNFYGEAFHTADKNPWVNPNPDSSNSTEYKIPDRTANDKYVALTLNDAIATDQAGATTSAYVIPFKYTEANVRINFTLDVTKTDGDKEINIFSKAIETSLQPEWIMNHQYCYNVTLTGDAIGLQKIEFSGTVSDWENTEKKNITINAGTVDAGGK